MQCTQCGFEFKYPCGCPYEGYRSSCLHDLYSTWDAILLTIFAPPLVLLFMPLIAACFIPVAFFIMSIVYCFEDCYGESFWAYIWIYFSLVAGIVVNAIVLPFVYLIGPFALAYALYEEYYRLFEPQTENI